MKKTFLQIKRSLVLAFAGTCAMLASYSSSQAQCTVSLTPTADTYVYSRPDAVNSNFGTQSGLPSGTWTWNGVEGTVRSYLRFNLATLPANATITSARLNMNGDVTAFWAGGHRMSGASNAAVVNPIGGTWAENTLTWNNQPAVGNSPVAIAQSTNNSQSYSLDVLTMVQNMYANPATNFGFRINQTVEVKWGLLIFGSRESANPALRPTLVVTYTAPTPTPTWVATPPISVCPGSTTNYSVNPIANATNYTWSLDGVVVNTGASPSYSHTWNAPVGNHTITVRATACGTTSAVLTSNVTIVAPPSVPPISGNTTVCVNQYTPLSNTVTGGVWSSTNTAVATVNSFGLVQGVSAGTANIRYTVTSPLGCATIVFVPVTVNGTLVFTINGPSTLCPNTSGNAYSVSPAVANADYTWNIQNAPSVGVNFPVNGSTSTQLSIPSNLTGSFILRCQGLNSCGASQIVTKTINISTDVPPSPDVTCSGVSGSNTCVDLVVSNYGTNSIEWIVNGVVQSTSPTFTRPLGTPVLCTYTSASGCKTSTWYSPAVTCTYAAKLAEEISIPVDKPFVIYPNPAKGVFKIQTKNQEGTASIYDMTGHLVQEIDLTSFQNDYTVEIGTAGMYTIHITTATETKGYKIVIE